MLKYICINKHGVRRVKTPAEQAAKRRQIELHKIAEYKQVVNQYLELRDKDSFDNDAFQVTTKLLALNPEYFSVWNYRRRILQHMPEDVLAQELTFIQARLREYPKVYWIWNHRRWCLENQKSPNWKLELGLVDKMLSMDARNYHGWHYRRYVVSKLEAAENKLYVDSEMQYTSGKINANFSNFSAWHNRSRLIPLHLAGKSHSERMAFLKEEISYITQAAYTDPDDQSAWIYLRWLVSTTAICPDMTVSERVAMIQEQIDSIEALYELEPNSKWCCDTLAFLTKYLYHVQDKNMDDSAQQKLRDLVSKLKLVDPMRSSRYNHLLTSLN